MIARRKYSLPFKNLSISWLVPLLVAVVFLVGFLSSSFLLAQGVMLQFLPIIKTQRQALVHQNYEMNNKCIDCSLRLHTPNLKCTQNTVHSLLSGTFLPTKHNANMSNNLRLTNLSMDFVADFAQPTCGNIRIKLHGLTMIAKVPRRLIYPSSYSIPFLSTTYLE